MHIRALLSLVVLLAAVTKAQADVSFNITFLDVVNGTGVGFDDPTLGATRRATFNSALTYLNGVLDENGSADLIINASETDGIGALAMAQTLFFTAPNRFSNGTVFQHIRTGTDPVPGTTGPLIGNEAVITFDFGHTWNSELDAPIGAEFDLASIALQQITQTLGFGSQLTATGNSAVTGTNPGVFSGYDTFLELGDGTDLFSAGGTFAGTSDDLISDDVFFNGPDAIANNGGVRPRIFARPEGFVPGASLLLDPAVHTDSVMTPGFATGVAKRTFSPVDIGILRDIGYNTAVAVPEPSAASLFTLMILGGVCSRRRRR